MKLFNKDGNGGKEIVDVLGMIGSDLTFSKWEPIIPLGIREVQAIIGHEPIDAADKYYRSGPDSPEKEEHKDDAVMDEFLRLTQQAVAMFTWLKVIPTLEAQHGNAGRGKRLGENEKGMTALQEFKDEENILSLAFEAVDALVGLMDTQKFDFWEKGLKKRTISRLLIQNKETFDSYYYIGSHRLFLVLMPIIREIQDGKIIPVITRERYTKLIEGDKELSDKLMDYVRRPLALLTMKKAVERLPVEVLPEGIVQVQQMGTIREKVKAEKEARLSVAQSLGNDAAEYLQVLEDIIKELDADGEATDFYIPSVTVQSKGISF